MNELAFAVHALVKGGDAAHHPLDPAVPEMSALADLQALLRQSPQDLAVFLGASLYPEEWFSTPPVYN